MRVSIGDCRLFVDIEGAGLVPDGATMRERPTVILLRGGPGMDHSSFKPQWSALTDIAQVVYYDHRGQGRSDRSTPDAWNLAQWAADLVALCDALGIVAPIAGAETIAAGIPHAQFERLADYGHGVWRDQPERAFHAIGEFITQ